MYTPVSLQELDNARQDVKSLEEVVNGDENVVVATRLGETYPSVKGSIKKVFETGGLPATPFATKTLMTASSLANGSYAVVTNDEISSNSGYYQKISGVWTYLTYNIHSLFTVPLWFKSLNSSTVTFDSSTRTLAWSNNITTPSPYQTYGRVILTAHSVVIPDENYQVVWVDLRDINKSDFSPTTSVKVSKYNSESEPFTSKPYQLPIFYYANGIGKPASGFFEDELIYNRIKSNAEVYADNSSDVALIEAKQYADQLSKNPIKDNIKQLYDDLHNPLMSVRIKLVGDSITWGFKASGESVADPRAGKITDPRNTTDAAISPSWANLLSRYLLTAFSNGAITHAANGLAYADSANTVTVSRNANLFSFYNKRLDKTYTSAEAVAQVGTSTTSETGEYFDLTTLTNTDDKPTELSFYTNADTFTLVYAELALSNASDYKVEILIDDVSHEVFSPYAATNAFNKRKVVIGQAGKHKITIRNITTGFYGHFRLQGIELARRLSVKNDGIIGSSTKSWLSTVKLSDSIASNDDYVFVQLGTNDRVKSANITLSDTAKNLRTIVSNISTITSDNAKVIMMSANAVTQTETNPDVFRFNMRDLNNCIKNVASDLGLPFISNYEQTLQTKLDGTVFLADGLHPNDVGYRIMFNNIKDAVTKR